MTTKTFTNVNIQLESLLTELTDGTGNPVFKNVLLGFPENDFRGFEFPLAVCYVKGGEYDDTFGIKNIPRYINSVIGVVVTGDTRSRYEKITGIMDIIQSQFHDNDDWIKLNGTVRRTFIQDSALTIFYIKYSQNVKKIFKQILSICKSFSLLIRTSKMKKPIQS